MSKLYFYTPTILEEAFIFTMGASVKETKSPIGFFGTGLKYAIAITLRLRGTIKIETNEHVYEFHKVTEKLRSTDTDMVYCTKMKRGDTAFSNLRCPMTLDYGKTWEPWQVMRELYSNTRDENGVTSTDAPTTLDESYTLITVDCAPVYDSWLCKDKYILNEKRIPAFSADLADVYYGSCDTFYYRGIAVAASKINSALTYQFKGSPQLSENRTVDVAYMRSYINHAMFKCTDPNILHVFMKGVCTPNTYEHDIGFSAWDLRTEASPEFIAAAVQAYKSYGDDAPVSFKNLVFKYLKDIDPTQVYKKHEPTTEQAQRLGHCLTFLSSKGFKIHKYKLFLSYDTEAMGIASTRSGLIILNPHKTLDVHDWEKQTCVTLIEEYLHLDTHAADLTRDFQEAATNYIYRICKYGEI